MVSNTQNRANYKKLTGVLFAIYLIVLSWIILFKMQFDIAILSDMNFRSVNLIPFKESLIVNGKVDISEIILNIVAFIPFGVYVSMVFDEWGFLKKTAPVFAVSLLYEVLQYIFAIGGSDITDLIGNTLGGVMGIVIFKTLSKIFKDKTIKVLNILAATGTVLVIGLLGLLIIANSP